MTTPIRTQGIILTRGSDEWDLRVLLHECLDWSDFRKGARKTGMNRDLPSGAVGIRDRQSRDVTGAFDIRVNGRWTSNSTPRSGGRPEWRTAMQGTLEQLLEFLQDDEPCTVTLKQAPGLPDRTGLLQVESPGAPRLNGHEASWEVEFTLPNGRLQVEP